MIVDALLRNNFQTLYHGPVARPCLWPLWFWLWEGGLHLTFGSEGRLLGVLPRLMRADPRLVRVDPYAGHLGHKETPLVNISWH